MEKKKINTLVITSSEILKELYKILSYFKIDQWFLKCTVLVISNRLKLLAIKLGWKKIYVSNKANNKSLLKKLIQINKKY